MILKTIAKFIKTIEIIALFNKLTTHPSQARKIYWPLHSVSVYGELVVNCQTKHKKSGHRQTRLFCKSFVIFRTLLRVFARFFFQKDFGNRQIAVFAHRYNKLT